jgi:hypothetical protein
MYVHYQSFYLDYRIKDNGIQFSNKYTLKMSRNNEMGEGVRTETCLFLIR